jgi:hypothetical protein
VLIWSRTAKRIVVILEDEDLAVDSLLKRGSEQLIWKDGDITAGKDSSPARRC